MKTKRCPKCETVSDNPERDFCKDSRRKGGLAVWCRKCDKVKSQKYRKTPDRYSDSENKECTRCGKIKPRTEFSKCARIKDGYWIYCRACQAAAVKACRNKNGKEWNARRKEKIDSNPKLRINCRILGLVRKAIERKVACMKPLSVTSEFWRVIGYTREQLCDHLESQFLVGMSWSNIGEWHIDHKKPVKLFDFKSFDDPEFLDCWGLHNLRPLWARDNLRKGARFPHPSTDA